MRYGFLFGAGAEIAYNLPSGGRFALDIFKMDSSYPKKKFKEKRARVIQSTPYASDWLPMDYISKNIGTFGKSVFQSIIMSTIEHRRDEIVRKINNIDNAAMNVIASLKSEGKDVDASFYDLLGIDINNVRLSQVIAYNKYLDEGNELFKSNYFSGLLLVYKSRTEGDRRSLGKVIMSIMQLHLGALSASLSKNINDNLFSKKDDGIDIFDDFGELIQLNYSAAGVTGLELLLEPYESRLEDSYSIILEFAYCLMEEVYASVLDYKSLIDSYWHYLYSPSSDWAKFCKISIFLLTVHEYINTLGKTANKDNEDGYYNMLKTEIDSDNISVSAIATTNYNTLIEDILGEGYSIIHLNGSVDMWYDPYLNKIGPEEEVATEENHITVPLLFTQSGTKPMTSIGMSINYVNLYNNWKDSDEIVIVGYGFGTDDEHINGILRTLVNDDEKTLCVVTLNEGKTEHETVVDISKNLKIMDYRRIRVLLVDKTGRIHGKKWTELLRE